MRSPDSVGSEVEPGRQPAQSEVRDRDSLEAFVERLTVLGATLDEVEAIKQAWPTWDQDDPEYTRRELVRLDDATLGRLMAEVRAEHVSNTMTEDEQAEAEYRAAVAGYVDEAQRVVVNSTVDGVLEWVGDDRAKARAAYVAELTVPDHKARKGVVGGLRDGFGFEDGEVPDEDVGPA